MSRGEILVEQDLAAAGSLASECSFPKDVPGALAYTPLASLTNVADVARDLPCLDYCAPRPGSLLENTSDADLQEIISSADVNTIDDVMITSRTVDLNYVRFLSLPISGDTLSEQNVELPKQLQRTQFADRFMEAIGVAAAEPAESHEDAVEIALEAKRNPLSFLEKRIRKKFSATVTDETVTEISPHENVRQREADTLRKRRRSSHGKVKESVSDALQPLSSAHCPENKLRSSAAQLTKQASESSSQMSTSACMAASALPPIDPMKMVTPARPVSKRLPGSSPHTSTSAGSAHYGSQTAALPTSARRNTRGLSDSSTRGSVSTGEVITTPSPSRPGPASIPAKKRRKLSATVSTPVVDSGEATSTPVTPRHDKPRVLVEIRSRISFSASSPGSQDQDFNDNSPTAKPIGEFSVDIPTVQASSPRRKSMSSRGPVLSSRAGEKLNEVLYELFAAEDSLDANDAQGRLLSEIFVPDANPDATPIVTTDFLRKVVSLVNKCAGAGKLDQVEDGKLTRLMKILDAQIRAVESLDLPFGENAETDECDSATTPTRRKSKGRCGMQVGERDGAEDDGEDDEAEVSEFAEQVTVKVEKILNGVEAAILALTMLSQAKLPKHLYSEDLIGACINLSRIHLANTVIPALRASALVKNQEQFAANGRQMMQLRRLLRHGSLKRLLTVVMPTAVSTLFQRLFDVIQLTRLSDSLVVSVGYASVMPFFVDMPTGVTRASAGLAEERTLDGIRLACLGLLRTIFAHHPAQRNWILEEIMTSLLKLPSTPRNARHYCLPDGKNVQMISALLLQLLQSCATGPIADARAVTPPIDFEANAPTHSADIAPTSSKRNKKKITLDKEAEQSELSVKPVEVHNSLEMTVKALKEGTEAAASKAGYIIMFLLNKCAQRSHDISGGGTSSRSARAGLDAEWRGVLDKFVEDVITLLHAPEWPAAELVLRVFSTYMVCYIDGKQFDSQQKAMAIDYLGTIASRLMTTQITHRSPAVEGETSTLIAANLPGHEISQDTKPEEVVALTNAFRTVVAYLEEDPEGHSVVCAKEYFLCEWGHAVIHAMLAAAAATAVRQESPSGKELASTAWPFKCAEAVATAVKEFCKKLHSAEDDDREPLPKADRWKVVLLVECLAMRGKLYQMFDVLLSRILSSLNSPSVQFRTKALKALQQVVVRDPAVLAEHNVRQTVALRVQDSSPAVREAAIDLIGRYLAERRGLTQHYYQVISERILDTGLSVRKRVVRIMRDIYQQCDDQRMMIDISSRLVSRTTDESSIAELAFKSLQEIWFRPFKDAALEAFSERPSADVTSDEAIGQNAEYVDFWASQDFTISQLPAAARKEVLARSLVFVGTASALSHTAVGIMSKIIKESMKAKRWRKAVCKVSRFVIDALVEHLLISEESKDKAEMCGCLNGLLIFSEACPTFLGPHVETLRPYLKNPGSNAADEQRIQYYVLKIYSNVFPCVNLRPEFVKDTEAELVSLLSRSTQMVIQVVVPCMCVIVTKSTHNFALLTKLLRSCHDKLVQEKNLLASGQTELSPISARHVMRYLLISGLLCQYFNFDKCRPNMPDDAADNLNAISRDDVCSAMFTLILSFTRQNLMESVQLFATQSLGCLFMSQPSTFLRDDARELMANIFQEGSRAAKTQLLRIFSDFLASERHHQDAAEEASTGRSACVDRRTLVGNAEEMGEASVSSSLMQHYLGHILSCLLSIHAELKTVAFDVVGHILEQGLVHPLQCMPAVVTMETDRDSAFRDKAFKLHQDLSAKHASFIHTKYLECVKAAYGHLKTTGGKIVYGYYLSENDASRPQAALNRLYAVLREERRWRSDFIQGIMKSTFDIDLKRTTHGQVDTQFARFVAENLAAFDYKTIEEVLLVTYSAERVASVAGPNILHVVEQKIANVGSPESKDKSQKLLFLRKAYYSDRPHLNSSLAVGIDLRVAADASVCVGILLILRAHLKRCYGLSEGQCRKFTPRDPGGAKDKPVGRLIAAPLAITWDRMPYAERIIKTDEDVKEQCSQFRAIIAEEGTEDTEDFFASDESDNGDAHRSKAGDEQETPNTKSRRHSTRAPARRKC